MLLNMFIIYIFSLCSFVNDATNEADFLVKCGPPSRFPIQPKVVITIIRLQRADSVLNYHFNETCLKPITRLFFAHVNGLYAPRQRESAEVYTISYTHVNGNTVNFMSGHKVNSRGVYNCKVL